MNMCRTLPSWLIVIFVPTISGRPWVADFVETCSLEFEGDSDHWRPLPEQKSCQASFNLSATDLVTLQRFPRCDTAVADEWKPYPFQIDYTLGSISGALPLDHNFAIERKSVVVASMREKEVVAKFQLLPCTTLTVTHNVKCQFGHDELDSVAQCVIDTKRHAADGGVITTVNEEWWNVTMVHGYARRCLIPLTDEIGDVILPKKAGSELILTVEEDSSVYVVGSRRQYFDLTIHSNYDAFPDAKMPITTADGRQLDIGNRKLMISLIGDKWFYYRSKKRLPHFLPPSGTFSYILAVIANNGHQNVRIFDEM